MTTAVKATRRTRRARSAPTWSAVTRSTTARPIASWRQTAFDGGGYFFKQAAAVTLITGLYLHLTRLLIADDAYVLTHVVTPTLDRVFAIVMTYAAVAGWLSRRYVAFTGARRKVILTVILVYITASLPLHYATYVTHSTELLTAVPLWYSGVFLVMSGAMLTFVWRLRIGRSR